MSGVDLLPAWPTSGDSEAAFNTKADALGPALSTMITQINTALGVTNISAWVSGAAYTAGSSVVWSLINFRPYRRKTTGSAGTTDPSLDTTNWDPVNPSPEEAMTTPFSFRNKIINGSFDLWQRGTSFANPTAIYTADRWFASAVSTTFRRVSSVYGYSLYAAEFVANSATNSCLISQALTQTNVRALQGRNVTLSFYYSASAPEPAGSLLVSVQKNTSPNTQTGGTWVTLSSVSGATSYSPTITVQRGVLTINVPADGTAEGLRVNIQTTNITNASSVYVFGVQLESGSVATPTESRDLEIEKVLCLAHYRKSFLPSTAPAQNAGTAGAYAFVQAFGASAAGQLSGYIHFGMPMFASPTITTYNPSASNAQIRCVSVGADCSASSVWSSSDVNGFVLSCTTAPGSSAGSQNVIHWAASAELT